MNKRFWIDVFIAFTAVVVWVVPLEFICRYWTDRHGDALDHCVKILRLDSELGWRQKINFHGQFLGVGVDTNEIGIRNAPLITEKQSGKRIVILGPSSTFGWGVPEQAAYPRRLEQLLRAQIPGAAVTVINAGEIGYSSRQGLEFYQNENFERLKPDIVVVAYGANDVDRYPFYGINADRNDDAPRSQEPAVIQSLIFSSRMFYLTWRYGKSGLDRAACYFGYGARCYTPPVRDVRVPLPRFRENLERFVSLAKKDRFHLIILTTASTFPAFPPLSKEAEKRSLSSLDEGKKLINSGAVAQAIAALNRSLAANPHQCEAHYFLAFCHAALRHCFEARNEFNRARKLEPFRIEHDLKLYNQVMRAMARKDGVLVADIDLLKIGTKSYFLDPIHPNSEGHSLIAKMLAELILKKRLLAER